MKSYVGRKVKINWDEVRAHSARQPEGRIPDENKEYPVVHDIICNGKIVGVEVDSGSQGFLYALRLEEIIEV